MATKEAKSGKKSSKDIEKKKSTTKLEKEELLNVVENSNENTNNSDPFINTTEETIVENGTSIQKDDMHTQSVYYEPPLSDMIVTDYVGEKIRGLYEGEGVVSFEGGHSYEGELSEGLMHGKGKYTWSHGLVYEGEFTRNFITGKGSYIWEDGSTYVGDVYNGKRHGFGTFTCKDQQKMYCGMWHEGKRHGKGRVDFTASGDSFYDGDWHFNNRYGFGTRQYPSGNMYVGAWQDNLRHGEGIMKWFDSDQIYEGTWDHGIQHGWGQHVWLLRRMSASQYPLRNMYIGEFDRGLRHGYGSFIYSSGARYDGEWEDNLKTGKGKFIFKNGRVYEGQFVQDRITEYPYTFIDGASSPDVENIRTRTPLPTEMVDSFSNTSSNTLSPSFQLNIDPLLAEMTNCDKEEEIRQVMFVMLQQMSKLRNIYSLYARLGSEDHESPDNTYIMKRMQLWRLLKDCHLHHSGATLCDMDRWLTAAELSVGELHDPNEKILQRQFINMIVILSYRIYKEEFRDADYILAACLTKLLRESILKNACKVHGNFYYETRRAINALVHYDQAFVVYKQMCSPRKYAPCEPTLKMREFLYMMKDCGLINADLTTMAIITVLSKDDPNAADGEGCCNLELELTFLEFLEALLGCAEVYVTEAVMKHPATPGCSSLFTPDLRFSGIGSMDHHSQIGEESIEPVNGLQRIESEIGDDDTKRLKASASNNTITLSDGDPAFSVRGSEKHMISDLNPVKSNSFVSSHGGDEAEGSAMARSEVSTTVGVDTKDDTCSQGIEEEELDDDTREFNFWTHQVHIFFSQKFFPAIDKLLNLRTRVINRKMSVGERVSTPVVPLLSDTPSDINIPISTEFVSAVA